MGLAKGGSFTGITVSRKELLTTPGMAFVSATVSVMIAEPDSLVSGRTVSVRVAPLPPSTSAALGTSDGFDETAVTVSKPGGVSKSPTVKFSGPSCASSLMF